MKNVNDVLDVVVKVAKETGKDLLVYATVGMAVMRVTKELSKAKDYFDKK